MAEQTKAYKDDLGTGFILCIGTDISDASAVSMLVTKPDGTSDTWSATVHQLTKIIHTIVAGDFDQKGEYDFQADITTPDGRWRGEHIKYTIYD